MTKVSKNQFTAESITPYLDEMEYLSEPNVVKSIDDATFDPATQEVTVLMTILETPVEFKQCVAGINPARFSTLLEQFWSSEERELQREAEYSVIVDQGLYSY